MKKGLIVSILLVCVGLVLVACTPQPLAAPQSLLYDGAILAWLPVEGAVSYEVDVDGATVAIVQDNYYTYTTRESVVFRVRALGENDQVGEFAEYAYTYNPPTVEYMNAPTIAEVNGEGELVWSNVPGASAYVVWVNSKVYARIEGSNRCYLHFATDGDYGVQVQAVGHPTLADSAKSTLYRVQVVHGQIVPPRLAAAKLSFDGTGEPLLRWQGVHRAYGYALYLNRNLLAVIPPHVGESETHSGEIYTYPLDASLHTDSAQTYTYSLITLGDEGNHIYRDSAHGDGPTFPLPTPSAPTHLEAEGHTLRWQGVDNCAQYALSIKSEYSTQTQISSQTAFSLSGLSDGTYRVRVHALGREGICSDSPPSAEIEISVHSGRVAVDALPAPVGLRCIDGVLSFGSVAGADAYEILVDTPYDTTLGSSTWYVNKPQWEVHSSLAGSILTVYVRALAPAGGVDSLWSEGLCCWPTGYDDKGDPLPTYTCEPIPSSLTYDGTTLRWRGSSSGYELCINGEVYSTADPQYEVANLEGTVRVRALGTAPTLDSPYSAEKTFMPTRLATPGEVTLQGEILSWQTVAEAKTYAIVWQDGIYYTPSAQISLRDFLNRDGTYLLSVYALGEEDSWRLPSLLSEGVYATVDYEPFGTEHKPYLISTAEDLKLLAEHPGAHFLLTADISVGEISPLFSATESFSGTLSGLHVDGRYSLLDIQPDSPIGLFGNLVGATLRDIQFVFADLSGEGEVVTLARQAVDSKLTNISITANLRGTTVAGAVLYATNSVFSGVSVQATLLGTTAGGIAVETENTTMQSCHVQGTLSANTVGGLVATATASTLHGYVGTEQTPLVAQGLLVGGLVANAHGCSVSGEADLSVTADGDVYVGMVAYMTGGSLEGRLGLALTLGGGKAYVGALATGTATLRTQSKLVVSGYADEVCIGGVAGRLDSTQDVSECSATLEINLKTNVGYIGGGVGMGQVSGTATFSATLSVGQGVQIGYYSGRGKDAYPESWQVVRTQEGA